MILEPIFNVTPTSQLSRFRSFISCLSLIHQHQHKLLTYFIITYRPLEEYGLFFTVELGKYSRYWWLIFLSQECPLCKKSFSTASCLRRHNRTFHSTVAAQFVRIICFYWFSCNARVLFSAYLQECDMCGVVCNRKDVLLRHIRKHKPESNVSLVSNRNYFVICEQIERR